MIPSVTEPYDAEKLNQPMTVRNLPDTIMPKIPATFPFFPVMSALGLVWVFSAPAVCAQEILPFPPKPSGSIAGRTIQESTYHPRSEVRRLPEGAPNIIIFMVDDAGPALPSTFGGEINTPTMDRLLGQGIGYNRFHTTAMCSPTRASLLTGRNHTRLGAGQIAELANDWDAYSGIQPKSSAMVPEVLKSYGYRTAAWGKWHNTPVSHTTAAGPFDYWPTGYGFEYFYGFLGGETSQFEPCMVRNTSPLAHPNAPSGGRPYHLTEDLADDAIHWLQRHKAIYPDQPFFMYWASGATHGPHQIMKEWADQYSGKFDDGWDRYRERVFARAKAKGWIPQNAQLTPRPDTLASWDSIPESERPFQRRLMEVFAGFGAHVDHEIGRVVNEAERLGYRDNTLIFYIWGDNGSSAEGQNGTISELLAQNGIRTTVAQHTKALGEIGGLDALGSSKTENMFHAGWAWAGGSPYKGTKLMASHFGGTRNPMIVSWPAKIKADAAPRTQFLHVIDVVPTLYELAGITPPRVVNGIAQDSIDGTSFAATFNDAKAAEVRRTQFFDVMGSRGIYHDGWFACTPGPRTPWIPGIPPAFLDENRQLKWTPDNDVWELYNINEDWTQASDLATSMPGKLAQMKEIFTMECARNEGFPIGGGLFTLLIRPDLGPQPKYTEWEYSGNIQRLPEFTVPKLGNRENIVSLKADIPESANGVLYAMGSFSGGLSCFVKDGILHYEYNLFMIERTTIKAKEKLPVGEVTIEVITKYAEKRPGGPLAVAIKVNGKDWATGRVPASAPFAFSTDCFDVGTDLGSPVSPVYFDKAPFPFNGSIDSMKVKYTE
jgi:arylsulfatase